MNKKIISIFICSFVLTFLVQIEAKAFTWFGLRKDNTEIIYQKSNEHYVNHHRPHPPTLNCHDPKHKHKPECKKKGPKPHRGWRKHK